MKCARVEMHQLANSSDPASSWRSPGSPPRSTGLGEIAGAAASSMTSCSQAISLQASREGFGHGAVLQKQ